MTEPLLNAHDAARTSRPGLPEQRRMVIGRQPPSGLSGMRVSSVLSLEWSMSLSRSGAAELSRSPADSRRTWIHRAPERQVLTLYREVIAVCPDSPAPWWLRAVHRGDLLHREAGFTLEDGVHELLSARPGWAYVPWVNEGEDGYWEYEPSDTGVYQPITVRLTDRHRGWVDVLPAQPQANDSVQPVPLAGPFDLRARISEFESWTA
ncbi:hypothetical protein NLX83_09160 [Allokutzneria sp. A3M-2-11 16]|uniref:hypothetical protein n=1 Tax=Allokutzneria sp. A3M-2-11 16 TaxID=2962043 RepID=UPI0020B87783|nr:hypothetical protein [Allokutzneria sp. A3M-2-11 16]MCP3799423.1 hypothetical protein [Allokutzneria sp. A3M-2-11 16]